ncbi:MAG: hypothetical protein UR26_C0002G0145 [candidate division TM6 bacterium GW2011_GWF2_32_72]|nr:MAG: hypothetical protein UR26_C0002G0145 [candidate division TM6 bacterium GW2011_GWF2_32_72]
MKKLVFLLVFGVVPFFSFGSQIDNPQKMFEQLMLSLPHGISSLKEQNNGEGLAVFLKDFEKTVDELIKRGVDITQPINIFDDGKYYSPVFILAKVGNKSLLELFKKNGVDPLNIIAPEVGIDGLMLAASVANIEAVKFFIENGADVSRLNNFGLNALQFLLENISGTENLLAEVCFKYFEVAELLASYGAQLSTKDDYKGLNVLLNSYFAESMFNLIMFNLISDPKNDQKRITSENKLIKFFKELEQKFPGLLNDDKCSD